jgi:hypothetical protein
MSNGHLTFRMVSIVFGIYFQCAYAILLTMQKFNQITQYQRTLFSDLGYLREMWCILVIYQDSTEGVV